MDMRGFSSTEEMNAHMIEQWNSRVRDKKDEVVILGDFSYGDAKQTTELLRALNGRKYLIRGNHDNYLKYRNFEADSFEWVKEYEELNDHKRKVILSHYPIMFYKNQYKLDANGEAATYMLYGHVHNTRDERLLNQFIHITRKTEFIQFDGNRGTIPCNMINCFCGFSNYMPLTLDEWIENDRLRREAAMA